MTDLGETFRVAGHRVQKAEPPEDFRSPSADGADIIGYQCVDCPKWGQAVAEFRNSPCARNPDHRGDRENPRFLGEALVCLKKAIALATEGHPDPALARAEEAEAHIEDYRRGPPQLRDEEVEER